jgi:dolichol-phosphate mannosyltransferase
MKAATAFAVEEILTKPETDPTQDLPGCLSVIIPVYNENDCIEELLRLVRESPVKKEIIIVDDGSTDGTRARLLHLPPARDLTLLFHQGNHGKGAAIRTGLQYARGEYVLIQDSDLEYDPQDYPALLQPLIDGKANAVYGQRPDRPDRGLSFFLGAKALTFLANLLYGCDIRDEATGYKAFRRSTLSRVNLECRRFEFCPEVTAKLSRLDVKIHEVPIAYNPRSAAQGKKIRWTDGASAIWTLLRCRFQGRRRIALANKDLAVTSHSPFPH